MYYAGFDLHSKKTTVWIEDENGNKVWSGSVPSTKEGWLGAVDKYKEKGIKIVIEAGRITYFAVDALRLMGIEPVVVNPRQVKLITESRKKSDKRDARILAQLLRTQALDGCKVHIPKEEAREIRSLLTARDHLNKTSTAAINAVRALVAQAGIQIKLNRLGYEVVWQSLKEMDLPVWMRPLIESHHQVWKTSQEQLVVLNKIVIVKLKESEEVQRMMEVPGVGAISALALVSAVDDPSRFPTSKNVSSYCGMAPRPPLASADTRSSGRITKEGRSLVRAVFVQAAHAAIRSKKLPTKIRKWVMRLILTKGIQKALVALANKLIRICFSILKNGTRWDPSLWEPAKA